MQVVQAQPNSSRHPQDKESKANPRLKVHVALCGLIAAMSWTSVLAMPASQPRQSNPYDMVCPDEIDSLCRTDNCDSGCNSLGRVNSFCETWLRLCWCEWSRLGCGVVPVCL